MPSTGWNRNWESTGKTVLWDHPFKKWQWTEAALIRRQRLFSPEIGQKKMSLQFKTFLCFKTLQPKIPQKVVSAVTASCSQILPPSGHEGEAVSSVDTRVPLWSQDHIRHEAVHSMPAGFHSLSFRFFPLLPSDEKTIPLCYFTVTNASCQNLGVSIIPRNPTRARIHSKGRHFIVIVYVFFYISVRRQCKEASISINSLSAWIASSGFKLLSCCWWPFRISLGPRGSLDSPHILRPHLTTLLWIIVQMQLHKSICMERVYRTLFLMRRKRTNSARFHDSSVKPAWYFRWRKIVVCVREECAVFVRVRLNVCLSSPLKPAPSPVCLYCGAAEALPVALSSTETQTPAAFTVTDLCRSLMSALLPGPWPQRDRVSTNHLQ